MIWRCVAISTNDLKINDEIRDKEVRLVGEEGEQLGVMTTAQAQRMADERNLDLVKIAPQAKPPVCKIMDYGKYRFELSKREKEQRKNQKTVEVKGIRLSATIDTHDLDVKAKAARRFLESGDKLKATIRFRGRQASHAQIGVAVMNAFFERIEDIAIMDRKPLLEGRNMTMMVSPKKGDASVKKPKAAESGAETTAE
jgi:translation initiation factor IF-3